MAYLLGLPIELIREICKAILEPEQPQGILDAVYLIRTCRNMRETGLDVLIPFDETISIVTISDDDPAPLSMGHQLPRDTVTPVKISRTHASRTQIYREMKAREQTARVKLMGIPELVAYLDNQFKMRVWMNRFNSHRNDILSFSQKLSTKYEKSPIERTILNVGFEHWSAWYWILRSRKPFDYPSEEWDATWVAYLKDLKVIETYRTTLWASRTVHKSHCPFTAFWNDDYFGESDG